MPTIDNRIIEALRRQQFVTEYIIYPFSDIKNYQIKLTNVPSFSKEDVLVVFNRMILPHWVESKGSVWTKIPNLKKNTPLKIYTLTGNPSAISASNGTNTFDFFDDYSNNLNKWQTPIGSPAIISGRLRIVGSSAWDANGITTTTKYYAPLIIEWKEENTITNSESISGWKEENSRLNGFLGLYQSLVNSDQRLYDELSSPNMYGSVAQTTNNNFYRLTIRAGNNVKLEVNSTVIYDGTTSSGVSNVYHRIGFEKYSGTSYYDDVRIRKYASPEPIIKKVRTLNKSLLLKELMR